MNHGGDSSVLVVKAAGDATPETYSGPWQWIQRRRRRRAGPLAGQSFAAAEYSLVLWLSQHDTEILGDSSADTILADVASCRVGVVVIVKPSPPMLSLSWSEQ